MLATRTIVGLAGMAILAVSTMASAGAPATHQKNAQTNPQANPWTNPQTNPWARSCPALPEVAWWDSSHRKIINYVDQKFQGEWDPYIDRWVNYRDRMQGILDRAGTAVVKSRNIRLAGSDLAAHIGDIDRRIYVTRCLKTKHGGIMA